MKNPRLHAVPDADPAPPAGLSADAANLWRALQREYGINDVGGLTLLQLACESFDAMRQAQALVAEHGACTLDRFGCLKGNPAATIVRDSRTAMLAAMRQLHLDIEPLRDGPGRPPGR
jgi:phage terminase small subunit